MASEEVDVRRFTNKESSTRVGRIPTPSGFPGLGDINSYLIFPEENSDELILIDTGVRSDEAWQALNDGLKQLNCRVEDITKILLTHGHTDHYGQAHRIHKASGCELWAHENLWMTIERMQPVSNMAPAASMAALSMLIQPIAADVTIAAVITVAAAALCQR